MSSVGGKFSVIAICWPCTCIARKICVFFHIKTSCHYVTLIYSKYRIWLQYSRLLRYLNSFCFISIEILVSLVNVYAVCYDMHITFVRYNIQYICMSKLFIWMRYYILGLILIPSLLILSCEIIKLHNPSLWSEDWNCQLHVCIFMLYYWHLLWR